MVTFDEPPVREEKKPCRSGCCCPRPKTATFGTFWLANQPQLVQPQTMTKRVDAGDSQPIFAVSDLHLGDGGPRDNFANMSGGERLEEFNDFLRFVKVQNGRLIIVGDLFDFWQANLSKVLTHYVKLLDTLAEMGAIYILGNHDADLCYFLSDTRPWLGHPFFKTMRPVHTEEVNGHHIHFLHGHQVDPYCKSDTPGIGRATAIYTGLKEDRHGGPMLGKYLTVEKAYLGWMEWLVSLGQRLCGKSGRYEAMNRELVGLRLRGEYDMLVSGHTHFAGAVGTSVYNTGTWAEQVNSFVLVNPKGVIGVFDWVKGQAVPNSVELRC